MIDLVNDPVCGPHVEWHRWPPVPTNPLKSTYVCGMNPVDSYSSVIDFVNDPVCGPHVEWHRWPSCICIRASPNLMFCSLEREYWPLSEVFFFCLIVHKKSHHFLNSVFSDSSLMISKSPFEFVVSSLDVSKSVSRTRPRAPRTPHISTSAVTTSEE